ncbi:protein kinase domain-containing protein [Citrus sinensis]|uniref:Protein kinase domain-containing protein n=1 Tax=Citrus sinensis TaxID=2711 RepID=A0ACB8JG71_CITSI|nr:protein kinase domain-containing protein [Citrus sinensis]
MDSTSIGTKYSATKNHSYDYHPSAQGDTFVSKRSTRDCAKIFEQWNPIAVIDIPFLMERMSSARMMNRFLLLHYLILSFMIASANTTSITTDQQALLSLKGHVTHDPANFLARNWNTSSPVCNWTGVTCDVRTHRVTALNISGLNLTGTIPSELGNLSSLQTLDLSFNWFSGSIPASIFNMSSLLSIRFTNNTLFGELPPNFCNHLSNLEYLFLKSNMFHGKIPSTLSNCKRLRNISLSLNDFSGTIPKEIGNVTTLIGLHLRGNKLQGVIPHEIDNLHNLEWMIFSFNKLVGVVPTTIFNVSTLKFLYLGSNSFFGRLPSSADVRLPNLEELSLSANQRRFTYLELFQATNGFSENNLIGRGGFGFVYKARIQDGMEVAVKVFDLQYGRAIKSFDIECGMIKRIRHRNIIKFINSCSSDDFKALVLEYMPYGSLEKCLYSSNYILDIFQRLNIMIDVASALEYLHFGYSVPIIHCDLKPNNVLLDDNMVAHLSDFGMAKPFLKEDQSLTQTQTLATIGYMAPEYGREGRVSTNGDVYSFGIMLMETFTRKKPTDESFTGEMTLKRWVNDLLLISIMEVVDANLLSHEDKHFVAKEQCMSFVFNLAMKCTIESPEERINAKEIVTKLAG